MLSALYPLQADAQPYSKIIRNSIQLNTLFDYASVGQTLTVQKGRTSPSTDAEEDHLPFKVREGERFHHSNYGDCEYTFGEVQVTPDFLAQFTGVFSGDFTEGNLEAGIRRIILELEQEGYLFAEIRIQEIRTDSLTCSVDVKLEADTGERFYVGEILFPGAEQNDSEYLKKLSGVQDSVLITPGYLNEIRNNLVQTELFTEVGMAEVYMNEGYEPVIVIPVAERNMNQFDGLLGYVPDPSGNGRIVGDFELSLWNVLNQGNGVELMFERLRPENTRLHLGISQNWIGDLPLGLALNFDLFQNDTTYQSRDLKLDAYYLMGPGLRVTGSVGQTGSTSGTDLSRKIEPDGKKRYAELGFQYSTLDNPEVPRTGLRLSAGFGVTSKSVDIDSVSAFSQRYLTASARFYLPLRSRSVIALSARGYFLNADQITDSDLLRFGGAKTLRGYAEEQFRGSEVLWGDVEYRYLLDRSSYLFAFGGMGYFHRPTLITELNNDFELTDTLYSTGFGISYKIRIGRLKFTYALSPQEDLGNGKIHVGIVTRL